MVKVIRIGKELNEVRRSVSGETHLSNNIRTDRAKQQIDTPKNSVYVSRAHIGNRSRTTMPNLLKDDPSKSEAFEQKNRRETYFTFRDLKHHPIVTRLSMNKDRNRVVPNDRQKIVSDTKNDKGSDLSNSQTLVMLEENTIHQQINVFPKWLLCLATGVIILGIGGIIAATVVVASQASEIPKTNWLLNGDAESGSCEAGSGTIHPLYWNYNGTLTAILYNNTNGDLLSTDPGPSDRGNCYFYGQISNLTSIWQTVTISASINPSLIDNQKIWYNFSAWMGGWDEQDDSAQVFLSFLNQNNQQVGSTITLGPVLAAERKNITSLIFHQTNGLVPSGARSFMVMVIMTRLYLSILSPGNDGLADNIAVFLYE